MADHPDPGEDWAPLDSLQVSAEFVRYLSDNNPGLPAEAFEHMGLAILALLETARAIHEEKIDPLDFIDRYLVELVDSSTQLRLLELKEETARIGRQNVAITEAVQ